MSNVKGSDGATRLPVGPPELRICRDCELCIDPGEMWAQCSHPSAANVNLVTGYVSHVACGIMRTAIPWPLSIGLCGPRGKFFRRRAPNPGGPTGQPRSGVSSEDGPVEGGV